MMLVGSCYRPQRSCGKVIFSQASVSHSVHGGASTSVHAGIHPPPGKHTPPPWEAHPPGSTHPWEAPPTVTAADGTHRTGMLSCTYLSLHNWLLVEDSVHFLKPFILCSH